MHREQLVLVVLVRMRLFRAGTEYFSCFCKFKAVVGLEVIFFCGVAYEFGDLGKETFFFEVCVGGIV